MTEQMSKFAGTGGARTHNSKYPYAILNDLVYPVHGGMEDWGYAASWDRAFVRSCTPRTYGGYAAERTQYNDAAARTFPFARPPPQSALGEACRCGFNEMAKALLAKGANKDQQNSLGWTALHEASFHNHVELVQARARGSSHSHQS